jgi:threonine dehydratase
MATLIHAIRETPLCRYSSSAAPWDSIFLKDETQQTAGSFKFRSAFHRLINLPSQTHVVTASTGNHGLAIATAAKLLGHTAGVFVPANTPAVKLEKLRSLGAEVTVLEGDYTACRTEAKRWAASHGALYDASFDDPEIIEGHRHLLKEIDNQARGFGLRFHRYFVPVGGGGLLAACCRQWSTRRTPVIGVEVAGMDSMKKSLAAGRPVRVPPRPTVAEGLAVPQVGEVPFAVCNTSRPRIVTVTENEILAAIHLLRDNGIRAEGAGAASLAAALKWPANGGSCLCLISGGNA